MLAAPPILRREAGEGGHAQRGGGGMTSSPLLDATGVVKNYGAVAALKNASLSLAPGEVHALMGANGAGKSTLVKILAGAIKADGGRVLIRGQERKIGSPASLV